MVNVNDVVPELPSAGLTSLMKIAGGASSSMITPVAIPREISPFVDPERATEKASSDSSITSPRTATDNVLLVCPARNVRVPECASKSLPDTAPPKPPTPGVPLAVLKLTLVATSYGAASMSVKFMGVVPLLASVTLASAMLIRGSSSVMVTAPCPLDTCELGAPMKLTTNCSLGSALRSPLRVTVIALLVSPGLKVSDPEAAR